MRGVTVCTANSLGVQLAFQLTRLMRGVTFYAFNHCSCLKFQLTRLMRGVTEAANAKADEISISTHTPHARRDDFVIVI